MQCPWKLHVLYQRVARQAGRHDREGERSEARVLGRIGSIWTNARKRKKWGVCDARDQYYSVRPVFCDDSHSTERCFFPKFPVTTTHVMLCTEHNSISFFLKRNKTPLPVFYFVFAAAGLCNWLQQSSRGCWDVLSIFRPAGRKSKSEIKPPHQS